MGEPDVAGGLRGQLAAYKRSYVDHFRRRLATYGEDVRALWNSSASQRTRFEVLCAVGGLSGRSVLDVGCGFGDLITYLQEAGTPPATYCGIDLSPEMIEIARKQHPGARLECRDLDEQPFPDGSYDFLLGSGLFFLPHPLWKEYVSQIVARMFACCRVAVAVNFLSVYSAAKDRESHYARPSDVLGDLQQAITPRIVLRHDYRVNDFTVYLYR